jgi:hypothetical protein
MPRAHFSEILRLLATNEVEFVVVGMTAGVLQGAPVTTIDLDVVHGRTPDNVARLLRVLQQLEAVYRHDPRGLRPQTSHLLGPGHQLLSTRLGDLDCLGEIDDGKRYEELLPQSVEMELGEGLKVKVLSLAELLAMKTRSGRPKDLAVVPLLRATIDEVNRR